MNDSTPNCETDFDLNIQKWYVRNNWLNCGFTSICAKKRQLMSIIRKRKRHMRRLLNGKIKEANRKLIQILDIITGPGYPVKPLEYEVTNTKLPRLKVDALRVSLRHIVEGDNEHNTYENWCKQRNNDFGIFDNKMVALDIVRETRSHLDTYRNSLPHHAEASNIKQRIKLGEEITIKDVLKSDGIDLSSIDTSGPASYIFNKTLEEICANIPECFRVLHIESVVRSDLRRRFEVKRLQMHAKLVTLSVQTLRQCVPKDQRRRNFSSHQEVVEKEYLADYLTTPKLTFHGTQSHLVPSIVRSGFLLPQDINPMTNEQHAVRCGSTYGRGIYSSPDAQFSLSYSGYDAKPTPCDQFGGLKLIVCATLMGRSVQLSRDDDWRSQEVAMSEADSHVANREFEYVVFDRAQILPCYVVHLDWGKDDQGYFNTLPSNPFVWNKPNGSSQHGVKKFKIHKKLVADTRLPGEIKDDKKALMAKAMKYFPYGYGPATGTSFVVEEVGEVSEDEEEYGEYQVDRVDDATDTNSWDAAGWMWSGMTSIDQYRQERAARSVKIQRASEVNT